MGIHAICRFWQVKSEPKTAKALVYSAVLVLLTAGDLDPWCRPFYNYLLQQNTYSFTTGGTRLATAQRASITPSYFWSILGKSRRQIQKRYYRVRVYLP